MPFFLKNTIFVARKILTTTDRHLLERAIFIGSCLLHHRWRSLYNSHWVLEDVARRPPSYFFLQKVVTICVSLKKKIVNLPMLKMLL